LGVGVWQLLGGDAGPARSSRPRRQRNGASWESSGRRRWILGASISGAAVVARGGDGCV